ncbi:MULTISPECIES: amidohydrolase [unclassified Leucobacter]|uniref:amidohydrolase n=1 Tax=unclassified Leucobacter TaxID=2621730 RepID=UPI00165E9D82|nr:MULTISPECIES: amidohydrolase family protein [unclassified Leucobacter]MBC9937184.1 amidohydrolase family protein [Leucobacter sp. cx-87]
METPVAAGVSARAEAPADLVLRGGTVLTLDEAGTRADSISVRSGRIVAVGGDPSGLIGAGTRVIELAGRTVLPGINDSHLHAAWLGARWPHTFFGAGAAGGVGAGHDPGAVRLLHSRADRVAALERAGQLLSEFGVTSYTDGGLGPGEDGGETGCFDADVLEAYRELAQARSLRQRVSVLGLYGVLDGPSALERVRAGATELAEMAPLGRPEWLRLAGLKIFGDGIPPMRQAWVSRPYDDGSHGGLLVEGARPNAPIEERAVALAAMVRAGHDAGLQVAVHATGDRTIQTVIDEVAALQGGLPGPGHYVIHGDLATAEQIAACAELGMFINAQSGIATATADWVAATAGPETADEAWRFEEALAAGVLALSSDAPILGPDWRVGVAGAEQRMLDMGASSEAGARERRLIDLLRAYTAVPAAQDGAASWKGTIEVGKVADLVVLGGDVLAAGAAGLPDVPVECTVLDGEVVYSRRV